MTTVYLALGSNVGDSRHFIDQAIEQLCQILTDVKQAPIYASKAIGYTDQPDFLNTAISGRTDLEPLELLQSVKQLEQELGRQERFRWGPREIDIDIIFYGETQMKTPELTIPHPEYCNRDFVLQPIIDLSDELVDPATQKTVKQQLQILNDNQRSILNKLIN